MDASRSHAKTGLVLTGGGARAAYQVGVLKAVARIRREVGAPRHNPFGVITGTSAGAINAAAIACHADRFDLSVAGLVNVWRHFSADQVYRADAFGVVRTGARWLTMLTHRLGHRALAPRAAALAARQRAAGQNCCNASCTWTACPRCSSPAI